VKRVKRTGLWLAGGVVLVAVVMLAGRTALAAAAPTQGASVAQLLEAVRSLYEQGRYDAVKRGCYAVLWSDIEQPEALYYLASTFDKLGDRDQAAVYYHLTERELAEAPAGEAPASASEWKKVCEERLQVVDTAHREAAKQYEESTAGKKFTSPQEVSDLWMSQVEADLAPLHGLYLWPVMGGRKDKPPTWIHNAQGVMHRSGAKYMDEVDGRKGVLFCALTKKTNRRLMLRNVGKGDVLRIGVEAYNFPFVLNVLADKERLFSAPIRANVWTDLEVPLGAYAGKDLPLALELVVPPEQGPHEGVFFDYVDFFAAEPNASTP
jgi:hypothetical protein